MFLSVLHQRAEANVLEVRITRKNECLNGVRILQKDSGDGTTICLHALRFWKSLYVNVFLRSPDKPTLRMTEGEDPGSGGAKGGGGGGRHSAIKQTSHVNSFLKASHRPGCKKYNTASQHRTLSAVRPEITHDTNLSPVQLFPQQKGRVCVCVPALLS